YQLHDLLREYAAERAEVESPDESDPAVIRLLDWYLHTTSNGRYALGFIAATDPPDPVADPVVTPLTFDTSGEARQWYEAERPTLGAALRLAADRGHDRHGWQLAYRLRDFYQLCEDIEDWMVAGNLGYQCAVRLGDPLALHLTANVLAIGYSNLGRFAEAMPILQVALDHARQLGDSVKVSTSLSLLGTCCQWSRDFERSIAYHEQSVATARGGTNRHRLGHSLLNLGCALIEAGKPDPGIGPTEEALAIYRELDATLPQALGLGNLAEAYEGLHRYVEAVEYAEQSIATFTAGGFDPTVGSLLALGRIRVALGERDLARAAWERAVTVLGHHDHPVMPRIRTLLASLDTG
ncbi:MAG: tetratricopeptide repeat protein, partial [Micromonosporaceae bacterium]